MKRVVYFCFILFLVNSYSTVSSEAVHPKVLDFFRAQYEKAQSIQDKRLKFYQGQKESPEKARAIRFLNLHYLHLLMLFERDLRILRSSKDQVDTDIKVKELSSQELKRIAKLREEIHEGEKRRIMDALKNRSGFYTDKRMAKQLGNHERDLDRIAERNTSKLMRDLTKLKKEIGKAQRGGDVDRNKIDELKQELKVLEDRVNTINQLIYGLAGDGSFEKTADAAADDPAAKLLNRIVSERDELLKVLRENGLRQEDGKKGGDVGGLYVYSANLGVVLDISGSMTAHITRLKKEIQETFVNPHYREIRGCAISGGEIKVSNIERPIERRDTVSAIMELVVVQKVDTIYWFCDLRDEVDQTGLRHLRNLLKRSGVVFHVKSVGEAPDRDLASLITEFKN